MLKKCKYVTNVVTNYVIVSISGERKWADELKLDSGDWCKLINIMYSCTIDTKLRSFQYRLAHRIIYLNKMLYIMKLSDTPLCTYCNLEDETIEHLFWQCNVIKQYLIEALDWLCSIQLLSRHPIKVDSLLGDSTASGLQNMLCFALKRFIYISRIKHNLPYSFSEIC